MKTITLEDMKQEDFDAAAQTVISGIKAYNRKLDTRDGTVLRDLLVNPEAAIEGVISGQIQETRKSSSLKMMKDAQDEGEEIDQEDVESILSNSNIEPASGKRAKGIIKVIGESDPDCFDNRILAWNDKEKDAAECKKRS